MFCTIRYCDKDLAMSKNMGTNSYRLCNGKM